MKVLIIGSGGREHALAWKVAQSPRVSYIYVAPGNGGTSWPAANGRASAENVAIPVSHLTQLCKFARDHHIDLTIVGPEAPLADGIVDLFHRDGLRIFGPTAAAAQLESSKLFSKTFMRDMGIPTASFEPFTDYNEAMAYLAATAPNGQVVVKASGLAAGKGVVVCSGLGQAQTAVTLMLQDNAFGAAGAEIIIEEKLSGPEISLLALSDGKTVRPLICARDHKRAFDGDEGANTGGMGAFAPVPEIEEKFVQEITERILQPTINGMASMGMPYIGVLYAGLMLTDDGPKVLEFNCRFGDPETQVILPLLKNDLVDLILACTRSQLDQIDLSFEEGVCATVVMASPGYPAGYPKGLPISGVDEAAGLSGVSVFHAGTTLENEQLITSGGRVLAVSGHGHDLTTALQNAYKGVSKIHFDGVHFRKDIGEYRA
ncbi:MAG: phosphoribosylamine--glycine ligase [Ardenticatenaceae bacterium]|nr:phosphoribosylamine--glycine ligase [Ardenticatenaceae bacterium]